MPLLLTAMGMIAAMASADGQDAIEIGSRRELMVDTHLIDTMQDGAELRMHHPVHRGTVAVFDEPWEGSGCGYVTVFEDDDMYRMYYKAWQLTVSDEGKLSTTPLRVAYAESADGVHWEKPELGIIEFDGSRANNLVFEGRGSHGFCPFKDSNPACPAESAYKAVGSGKWEGENALWAMKSADGLHWSPMGEEPIITEGAFDSQNLAFWDGVRGEYRAYVRDFRESRRGIRTATSEDFINWTRPAWLQYPGAPKEHLYTNHVQAYYRAPHIFMGFPTRYIERGWSPSMRALPEPEHRELRSKASNRYGMALSEALFMTSRDGLTFHRWPEAFVRPGIQRKGSWAYGDHYLAWPLVETDTGPGGTPELSLYSTEGYWTGRSNRLCRYSLRVDGFVSAQAPLAGGEVITKPLVFEGDRLFLNFSTSAAGSIEVELQDANGEPLPGFSLSDCAELFGDELSRMVQWEGGADVGSLEGTAIRIRFVLRDADLYSFRFGAEGNGG